MRGAGRHGREKKRMETRSARKVTDCERVESKRDSESLWTEKRARIERRRKERTIEKD